MATNSQRVLVGTNTHHPLTGAPLTIPQSFTFTMFPCTGWVQTHHLPQRQQRKQEASYPTVTTNHAPQDRASNHTTTTNHASKPRSVHMAIRTPCDSDQRIVKPRYSQREDRVGGGFASDQRYRLHNQTSYRSYC